MDDPRLGQLQELAAPILEERQMELVEMTCRPQSGQLMIRLLVERVGGVTIAQCAQANQQMRNAIEASGIVPEDYTVEVSSPGLDRPLAAKRDFERAVGEDVWMDIRIGEGRFRELNGMLLAVQPEAVVVKTPQGNVTVSMADIRIARKALRW